MLQHGHTVMKIYPYAYMTYIVSPLVGLGGGISWRPPAYSLLLMWADDSDEYDACLLQQQYRRGRHYLSTLLLSTIPLATICDHCSLCLRPHKAEALSDAFVWRLSVAYIGRNSRTEMPRKTKIDTEVAHVTRDSDTIFKSKGQRSTCCWCLK